MKSEFPLLYPFISLGISKLEDYIQKSRSSRIYSLAIRESLISPTLHLLDENPFSPESMSENRMDREKLVACRGGESEDVGDRHGKAHHAYLC